MKFNPEVRNFISTMEYLMQSRTIGLVIYFIKFHATEIKLSLILEHRSCRWTELSKGTERKKKNKLSGWRRSERSDNDARDVVETKGMRTTMEEKERQGTNEKSDRMQERLLEIKIARVFLLHRPSHKRHLPITEFHVNA